jgi:hypothetical protein
MSVKSTQVLNDGSISFNLHQLLCIHFYGRNIKGKNAKCEQNPFFLLMYILPQLQLQVQSIVYFM